MSSEKILIVDDTKIICIALRLILSEEGYEVDAACDGEEAIQRCRLKKYDIVFLDLIMPGVSGIETCRSIKNVSPDTECILMTGHTEQNLEGTEEEFKRVGGKICNLYKPFDGTQLLHVARRVLAERAARVS